MALSAKLDPQIRMGSLSSQVPLKVFPHVIFLATIISSLLIRDEIYIQISVKLLCDNVHC